MNILDYKDLNDQIDIYKDIYNKTIINYLIALLNLDIPATYPILDNKFQIEELMKHDFFKDISAYNLYQIILQEMEKYDLSILKQNNKFGIKNNDNHICNFVYNGNTKIDIFASQDTFYTDIILKTLRLNQANDFKEETEYDSRLGDSLKVKKLINPYTAHITIR